MVEGEPDERWRFVPYGVRRKQWREELKAMGLSGREASAACTGYEAYRRKKNELIQQRALGIAPLPPKERFSEGKNERRNARWRYARVTLGLDTVVAHKAAQSAKALIAAAPEGHVFPPELIERRRGAGGRTDGGGRRRTTPEWRERYQACKALGMNSVMAGEGAASELAFGRIKREWARIQEGRGMNDNQRERARG